MKERPLSVRDKIVVHLARFSEPMDADKCLVGMTRPGMAKVLGNDVKSISNALDGLIADGLVKDIGHRFTIPQVRTQRNPSKAFAITQLGRTEAKNLEFEMSLWVARNLPIDDPRTQYSSVSISDAVLLHLLQYHAPKSKTACPMGITINGIGDAICRHTDRVRVSLHRLMALELVRYAGLRYPKLNGCSGRICRTYLLTPKGRVKARELKRGTGLRRMKL